MAVPTGSAGEALFLDVIVVAFLALFVGVPAVILARYFRLTAELRILARRTRLDRTVVLGAVIVVVGWHALLRLRGPYPDTDLFVAGSAIFVFGVFLLSIAGSNADWYRATDVPISETGFVHEGPVQVTGEAQPVDDPLVGLFSGEPCLAYTVSVQERRWGSRTSMSVPIATDVAATRFTVDDGSGEVLVDPSAADVLPVHPSAIFARDVTLHVAGEDSPPDAVRESFDDLGIGPSATDRTYREAHIQPGDEVYVVGSVQSVGYGYESNRVVADAGDAPAFVVTVDEDVRSSVRGLVRSNAAYGSVLAGVGAIAMVWLVL